MATIGTASITLTDISDAIIAGSMPASTNPGQLWIDTSGVTNVLKVYKNGQWITQELDVESMDSHLKQTIQTITDTLGTISDDNKLNHADRVMIVDSLADILGVVPSTKATNKYPTALPDYTVLDANGSGTFASYRSSAIALGIESTSGEYIELKDAYLALINYLQLLASGNVMPWDITEAKKGTILDVDSDQFRQTWLDYYMAEQALVRRILEVPGPAGAPAISGILDNDSVTIPTKADGTGGIYTRASTKMLVYVGDTNDTAKWSFSAAKDPSAGIVGTLTGNLYVVSSMAADTGYVDLTASREGYASVSKRFSLTKAKQGDTVVDYWVETDYPVIVKDRDDVYTPTALTITAHTQTGTELPKSFSGIIKIEESNDGKVYTSKYTSTNPESSKVWTPSAGIKSMRIKLLTANGVNQLDYEIVQVVADGKDGADGYSPIYSELTNESMTITTDVNGANGGYGGAESTIHIYQGQVEVTDQYNISVAISEGSGITGTRTGSTYKVTNMTADSGYVDFIATRSGHLTLTRRFTISKSKTGAAGKPATSRWLTLDTPVIRKMVTGAYFPASITMKAWQATGDQAPTAYTGRFRISINTGGSTYTVKTTTGDVTSHTYSVPENVTGIKIELLSTGGATWLDEETIQVIQDGKDGAPGKDGLSAVVGFLTNENISVQATYNGAVSNYGHVKGTFEVYYGNTRVTGSNVSYSVDTANTSNLTVTIDSVTGAYSVTGITSGTSVTSGVATLKAIYEGVTITKVLTVTKSMAGTNGGNATAYWMITSAGIVSRTLDAVFTPSTITFTGKSKTGTAAPTNYSGRFVVEQTTNGSTWTSLSNTGTNVTSVTVTPTGAAIAVRAKFYLAGGTSVLLDEQTVPIVTDITDEVLNDIKDDIDDKTGTGLWKLDTYMGTTDLIPELKHTRDNTKLIKSDTVKDFTNSTVHTAATNKVYHLYTHLETAAATSIALKVDHTAGITILVNGGEPIYSSSVSGLAKTVTLPLAQGWNTVDILLRSTTAGAYVKFDKLISASVVKMSSYLGGGVSTSRLLMMQDEISFAVVQGERVAGISITNDVINGANVEISGDTTFKDDIVMDAGSLRSKDGGVDIDLNAGTINLTKPLTINFNPVATKQQLDEIELTPGKSAYELAVDAGFVGTESQWRASLKGDPGEQGPDGISPIVGLLTNESITLPASDKGVVPSFTGATGTFEVYDGTTRKTGSGVAYSVSGTPSGITVSINATTGVYTVSAMTAGAGVLSGTATLRAVYGGVTIDKILTVTKALAGPQGMPSITYSWVTSAGMVIDSQGNIRQALGQNSAWTEQAYTKESYTGGALLSFKAGVVGNNTMFGLNTDPATDSNYLSLDYAYYMNGTTVGIYESGTSRGSFGTYAVGDTFQIVYDGVNVKYYHAGVLDRTVAAPANLKLHIDSSFYNISAANAVTDIYFGPSGSVGATGSAGQNATTYWINASTNAIKKDVTGTIVPNTITFSGFSKTGTANPVAYAGRFIIQTSTDGVSYTTAYTSSANQSSYTYTIPATASFVKARYYLAGGTSTLLDEQTIPVLVDAEGIDKKYEGQSLLDKTEILSGTEIFTDKADDSVVHVDIDGKSVGGGSGKNIAHGANKVEDWSDYINTATVTYPQGNSIRVENKVTTGTTIFGIQQSKMRLKLTSDKTYVMSYMVRGNISAMDYVYVMNSIGANQTISSTGSIAVNSEWNLVWHRFSPTAITNDSPYSYLMISVTSAPAGAWFEVKNIQLEESTVATSYELPAPTPDYPTPIHSLNDFDVVSSVGRRNVLNGAKAERTSANEYIGIPVTSEAIKYLNKKIKISFELKLSASGAFTVYSLGGYSVGSNTPYQGTTEFKKYEYSGVFTKVNTTENWCHLSFYATYGTGRIPTVRNVKIEIDEDNKGATPYTPSLTEVGYDTNQEGIYKTNILLSEPLRSVGDVKDRLFRDSDGLWKVEKNVGERVFTGAEFWGTYAGQRTYTYNLYEAKIGAQTSVCSHFANKNGAWDLTLHGSGVYSDHGTVNLRYFNMLDMTTAQFKAWLAEQHSKGTPVTITYVLATPTIETLPQDDQDKLNNIASYKNSNYLYTVVDKTNILPSYVRDNLNPTLHATFKGGGWYARFKMEQGFNQTNKSVDSLKDETIPALKDGLLNSSEKEAVRQSLNVVSADKKGIDTQYTTVYGNTALTVTAKTNIYNSKVALNTAFSNLESAINAVLGVGDGTRITATQMTLVTTRLNEYGTALSTYNQRYEQAQDAISTEKKRLGDVEAKKYVDDLEIGGRNYIKAPMWGYPTYNPDAEYDGKGTLTFTGRGANLQAVNITGWVPEQGATYTLSGVMKINGVPVKKTQWTHNGLTTYIPPKDVLHWEVNDTTGAFVWTVKWTGSWIIHAGFGMTAGQIMTIEKFMMVKGNKALDWSLAPEDVEIAYKAVSKAERELAEVNAKAYADGVVDAEEKRAIADAQAKLNEAKKYVDDVEIGGRNLIVSKDIVQGEYLLEGTGTVGAANSHARTGFIEAQPLTNYILSGDKGVIQIRFVAYDAQKNYISGVLFSGYRGPSQIYQTPANTAYIRVSAEYTTRTHHSRWMLEKGTKATDWTPAPEDVETAYKAVSKAERELAEVNSKAYADGKITAEENRAIADAQAKLNEAKKYVDDLEVGGRNLYLDSGRKVTSSGYNITSYNFAIKPIAGEKYTLSIKGKINPAYHTGFYTNIFDGTAHPQIAVVGPEDLGSDGVYRKTFTMPHLADYISTILYSYPLGKMVEASVEWIKLEKGNKATDWTEAPEDVEDRIGQKADGEATNAEIEGIKSTLEGTVSVDDYEKQMNEYSTFMETVQTDANNAKTKSQELDILLNDPEKGIVTNLGEAYTKINSLEGYLSFDGTTNTLTLARTSNSSTKIMISDTSIDFMDGNDQVASITNQYLKIERGIFASSVQISKHIIKPDDDDPEHLVFTYLG